MIVKRFSILCMILLSSLFMGQGSSSRVFEPDFPPPDVYPANQVSPAQNPAELQTAKSPFKPGFFDSSLAVPAAQAPQIALGATGLAFRNHSLFGVADADYPEPQPYPNNPAYLNGPDGIFVDNNGSLYVAESEGSRLLRYDASGNNTLNLGNPGWHAADAYGSFHWLSEVYVDSTGDIWVTDASRLSRFSSSGELEMTYPASLNEAGVCAADSGHFCYPHGVAMDLAGKVYVSDTFNHRIQVFTVSDGELVYSATIGTGTLGTANNQFAYPMHIASNSANQLFVADTGNHRVQKCTYSASWTCATFHGVSGVSDKDASHLATPYGVSVDNSGNVYIADTGNNRVKKCTSSGSCAGFKSISDPLDVANDLAGNVYVSSWINGYTVNKYSSAGTFLGYSAGTYQQAYESDDAYIFSPYGIGVDASGNIYVSESYGNRWLKIDPAGGRLWSKGIPGMRSTPPDYLGDWMYGNPGVDNAANRLYLPTGDGRCVRIYDLGGVYQNAAIGTCDGASGDSGTLLGAVGGVAVSPLDGKVYVVDRGNHKVKVYSGAYGYLNVLGQELGDLGYGTGNYQFKNPIGIAIDSAGSIYVADNDNHRVQKYSSSGVYQLTIGVTGSCYSEYGYLCSPTGVAVDSQNNVYVAENGNNRVTVYDSAGALRTTIGGRYGTSLGTLNGPSGVAVAPDGTVYVTEQWNQRVQVFKPGVPGWDPVNVNGFGTRMNERILSMEAYDGNLYAGTYTSSGAQVWRMDPAFGWEKVAQTGLTSLPNVGIDDFTEFKGNLYAGTWANGATGAEIWRSESGDAGSWERVVQSGFGSVYNGEVMRLTEFGGQIYAATWSYSGSHGAEVWRSETGGSGTWDKVVDNGFGSANNNGIVTSEVHNGYLYLGTYSFNFAGNGPAGAEIWRSATGNSGDWAQVNVDGFGSNNNCYISALASFGADLYALVSEYSYTTGAQIYRCHACDGSDWTKVVDGGLGRRNRNGMAALVTNGEKLFWVTPNYDPGAGLEVWTTSDGAEWHLINIPGFGDQNNNPTYWDNAVAFLDGDLYVSAWNSFNGAEIWRYQDEQIYLPVVRR